MNNNYDDPLLTIIANNEPLRTPTTTSKNNENKKNLLNSYSSVDELNTSSLLDEKNKKDLEVLIDMGFDSKMIKKVMVFLKPNDINETVDYLSEREGIYQHDFLKRHNQENVCFICGAPPDKHINYVPENPKRNIIMEMILNKIHTNNRNSLNSNNINTNINKVDNKIEILTIKNGRNSKKNKKKLTKCMLCEDEIPEDDEIENSLSCNHIFCSDCYLNYLDDKINTNKVGNITCMQNKCPTILNSEFIISHLKGDERLINKYKKFKLRNDLYSDPNVKFCPIPDCESYAKKEGDNKYVQCLEGHKFCFECSKPWHGKKKCQDEIDKDFKKWKKNKVLKRCPKCKMWTEKNHGCNHMTCAECKYQWCWLCGGKYSNNHFEVGGGCAGLQFTEGSWVNNCILLYMYKILIFILQFLAMVLGFLPVSSFFLLAEELDKDFYDNFFSRMFSYIGWVFWMIPYFILCSGFSLAINIFTFFYWPLQEKILGLWKKIFNV